ncbi:MAG TPA: DUF3253 domain-containing protein [Drouetiella sp.]
MSLSASKREKISANILSMVDERGPSKTICPSDVARALFPDSWRDEMDNVRTVADGLVQRGLIEVTQKGKAIASAADAHGPIRLRKKA